MRLLLAAAFAVLLLAPACGAGDLLADGDRQTDELPAATAEVDTGEAPPADKADRKRAQEKLNEQDMAAAEAAVQFDDQLLPGWRPAEPTPDTGSKCKSFQPNLSKFTVTGKARSAVENPPAARIEFSVKIYASPSEASEVFRRATGRRDLRCIRDGITARMRGAGITPRVLLSEILREPPVGTDTMIYALHYKLTKKGTGKPQDYPVEVIIFRMGRAVGAAFFTFIADKEAELVHARAVANRLRGI